MGTVPYQIENEKEFGPNWNDKGTTGYSLVACACRKTISRIRGKRMSDELNAVIGIALHAGGKDAWQELLHAVPAGTSGGDEPCGHSLGEWRT